MMLVDTHVNLHSGAFDEDRAELIARARAAGVGSMVTICDKWENAAAVRAVAESDPHIWASVGAHPHYAKDHQDLTAEKLIAAAENPKIVAIGETGLDLHYGYSPIEDQVRAFRAHIAAARETQKPLIVHTREADAMTAEILEEATQKGAFPILLHCYTSGMDLARRGLSLGAMISFSGILTFKNAHDVRAVADMTPLDRLVLETDCPYLAPVPHRGRRCEPAFLPATHAYVCALKGISVEEGAARFTENAAHLFRITPMAAADG